MKKLLSVFTILSLFSFTSLAQNNTIALGVDAVILNDGYENSNASFGPSLTFESAIGKKFSLQAKGAYLKNNLVEADDASIQMRIKNFETGVNFYPKAVHKGFFVGLDLAYTDVKYVLKSGSNSQSLTTPSQYFGGGLNLGFKTKVTNRITFGTIAGIKVMADTDLEEGLFNINIGANVGYKF